MLRGLAILNLCITATLLSYGQGDKSSIARGGVTGFVSKEDGQPANGAQVCTEIQSGDSKTINCKWPVGADGRFTIDQLPPGTYQIFAVNEDAGYSIETQGSGQRVTITPTQLWKDIVIRMRQPGGIVSGSVTDGLTGKPIRYAHVFYSGLDCESNASIYRMKDSGTFDLTVPPSCDLVLMARARGYRGWVFTDPSQSSRPVLNLAAGQRKEVHIRLEPLQTVSPSQ